MSPQQYSKILIYLSISTSKGSQSIVTSITSRTFIKKLNVENEISTLSWHNYN